MLVACTSSGSKAFRGDQYSDKDILHTSQEGSHFRQRDCTWSLLDVLTIDLTLRLLFRSFFFGLSDSVVNSLDVFWLCRFCRVLDLLHFALVTEAAYFYSVTNFTNPVGLMERHWFVVHPWNWTSTSPDILRLNRIRSLTVRSHLLSRNHLFWVTYALDPYVRASEWWSRNGWDPQHSTRALGHQRLHHQRVHIEEIMVAITLTYS